MAKHNSLRWPPAPTVLWASFPPLVLACCPTLLRRAPLIVAAVLSLGAFSRAEPGPVTLEQLIQKARENDLRVAEAEAELRNLRAKYDEARWAWFPKFETHLLVAGPTPEARNDGLGGPPTTEASLQYDLNFGQVGAMFRAESHAFLPLYTFGKLSALADAGRQGVAIGEGLRERARNEAAFQVAQAYFGYQLARQGRGALQETLGRLDEATQTLQRLMEHESPQVTRMDLYKLEFFRRQVEARLSQAEQGLTFALAAIRLISGAPPGQPLAIAEQDLPEPKVSLKPLEAYLTLAEAHRPELRSIDAGIAAREREVFIRERMFYPDLGLAGFARWMWTTSATRQRSPFAYDPYNDLGSGLALVGRMTFDIPIKQAQLDQSRAELEKLTVQRELLKGGIRLELEKVHGELKDALERARAQWDAERSARRWATAAAASFDLGTTDTRELVDSFTALAAASGERLRAWHDVQVGIRALSKASGAPVGELIGAKGASPSR